MLQIRSDDKQGKAITDGNGNSFWMSPQRDLIHAYPAYVRKALVLTSNRGNNDVVDAYYANGGSEDELEEYAIKLARFAKHCVEADKKGMSVHEVVSATELEDSPPRVRALFGYCFTCVVLGAYHGGVDEARGSMPIPYLDELDVKEIFSKRPKGVIGWLKSKALALFRP